MSPDPIVPERSDKAGESYQLDVQVGFILRRAHQRASAIFAEHFRDAGLSPVQFSALVRIRDEGWVSQNQLGRLIHMDPATIMGVISRLVARKLVRKIPDPNDGRRMLLSITSIGLRLVEEYEQLGFAVTEATLAPLDATERRAFLDLLVRLI